MGGSGRRERSRVCRDQPSAVSPIDDPVADQRTRRSRAHPRERLHPFGTARIARLLLPAARIEVPYAGWSDDLRCELPVPDGTAVLYPHPGALDLAALPAAERPPALVVLDGTWAHARRLYADNPWLQRLRHVRLHPDEPSNYRIRKEPQRDFVSTIEAIVMALRILEPDHGGLDAPLQLFDRMIDRQLAHLHAVPRHGRKRRPRQRPSRRLPPVLGSGDLVVAYAEASMPGGDPAATRELVQWTAVRLRDGAVFDAVIRPRGPWPSASHLGHMQLDAAALHGGEDRGAALQRFGAFARDAALLVWTRTSLDWAPDFAAGRATALLKTAYCNLRNHRASYLEDVVAREGLRPIAVACRGRAQQRLANAAAVAHWLRAQHEVAVAAASG